VHGNIRLGVEETGGREDSEAEEAGEDFIEDYGEAGPG